MIYWENSNGTFSVPYWLITFEDGSTMTVYEQKLVLDHMEDNEWERIEIKHSVRYRRPTLGTEVPSREA
jgi:hypothetical protein